MSKYTLVLPIIILFFGCRQNNFHKVVKVNNLLTFYKDTIFSGIYIYPDTSYLDSFYPYQGKLIDSVAFSLLPKDITQNLQWTEGFFGIYSFKIDKHHLGLLTRTPGEYSSTVISLWIYDVKKNTITYNLKLADIFGDAGEFESIKSYLFFDKNKDLMAFTYKFYSYDPSIQDELDTLIQLKHNYNLTKINTTSIDTISKDSLMLQKQFASQLNKMVSY